MPQEPETKAACYGWTVWAASETEHKQKQVSGLRITCNRAHANTIGAHNTIDKQGRTSMANK